MYLGIDTSNYTTSAALYGDHASENVSRLLEVRPGELGLRQSDALFQHVKRLPELLAALLEQAGHPRIDAVAASTRPRAVEGSYMPCFLAGEAFAKSIAAALHVPFYAFSHQQGHVAAALWSAGKPELLQAPHLAWHLSGGTTELLYVKPDRGDLEIQRIGGTTDISAGQVIDRAGKQMGIAFPAGKTLDELAQRSRSRERFKVRLQSLEFSLSGLENKVSEFYARCGDRGDTAAFCLLSISDLILRATQAASALYPGLPVVFSGGVSSSGFLRSYCGALSPIFAAPRFSTDNAMGIAVLCQMQGDF